MKDYKLFVIIGLAVGCLFASCKKNNGESEVYSGPGFRAVIEQAGDYEVNDSKTHISTTWADGSQNPVLWSEGDCIKVANLSGGSGCTTLTYQLHGPANGTDGIFNCDEENDDFFQPDYVAIYPATNADGTANTVKKSGSSIKATFNLPSTQIYSLNSFAEKSMPMVAYSNERTLEFKNVLGGICFPLVSPDGQVVTKVELISKSTSDRLWGTCTTTISTSGGNPSSTISNSYSNKNTITLDCGSGVTLQEETPTYFCFMVPPGTLTQGFTVKAYSGPGVIYEKKTTQNPGSGFILRSVIRLVNENLDIDEISDEPLVVTTISPTFISVNSALGLGSSDHAPAACGILYAKAEHLGTPAEDLVMGGANVNNVTANRGTRFESQLTGLAEDEIYYVRAWAQNGTGTYYGDPIPFATRYDYFGRNQGKSRSTFSLGENKAAFFSMGNLQYQASTNNWKFADYQFEFVGGMDGSRETGLVYANGMHPDASLNGEKYHNFERYYSINYTYNTYSGWVDLFAWGTSGIDDYTPIANQYQPWILHSSDQFFNPYGALNTNLNSNSGKADWGYNAIINGGNVLGQWRTPQGGSNNGNTAEWDYLFNTRTCSYRYAFVYVEIRGTSLDAVTTVNGVKACGISTYGTIVFPDTFAWPNLVGTLTTINDPVSLGVNRNYITEAQWSLLEQAGAIYLPHAGFNNSSYIISGTQTSGFYWSATYYDDYYAYCTRFVNNTSSPICNANSNRPKGTGCSVRLVRDVE